MGKKIVVLVLVLALIVGGTILFERQSRKKQEAELLAEREKMTSTQWSNDNTLDLDGDIYGMDHRLETFLFVGTDLSGTGHSGRTGEHQPMADFIMLMVLDHTNNSIAFLQIDRNTVTQVDELKENGELLMRRNLQICTAHWYGYTPEMGAENLSESVKIYLGGLQNIDGYYVINMEDIEKLNASLGGIEVTLEDDLTSRDPAFVKGKTITLTDEQAEKFLRARVNLEDESNPARMSRQRQYMSGLFAKVQQKTAENPEYALELWKTLKHIATTNMNGNDFSRIAQKLLKGENRGFYNIDGETKEGYIIGDGIPHDEFYTDMKSLKKVMIDLFSLTPVEIMEEDPEEEEEEIDDGGGENEWIEDEEVDDSEEDSDDAEIEEDSDEDEEDEDAEDAEEIPAEREPKESKEEDAA